MASRPRYKARERDIIYAAARAGRHRRQIVVELLAEGFTRDVDALRQNSDFWRGRREHEAEQAELAARVKVAPLRGVRHHLFPTVTLPRLAIQAGWAS